MKLSFFSIFAFETNMLLEDYVFLGKGFQSVRQIFVFNFGLEYFVKFNLMSQNLFKIFS